MQNIRKESARLRYAIWASNSSKKMRNVFEDRQISATHNNTYRTIMDTWDVIIDPSPRKINNAINRLQKANTKPSIAT